MQPPIREAVMAYLSKQKEPRTRAQIAAALPDIPSNSINRMLRDMVKRGTAVETRAGLTLAPLTQRMPTMTNRKEN